MKGGKLVKKAALQSLQSFAAPSAFSMANGRKILIFNISCFSCVSMPLFLFPKSFKVQHRNLFYMQRLRKYVSCEGTFKTLEMILLYC